MKCPAITSKGLPCAVPGEAARGGWCHIHDRNGKYQQNIKERRSKNKTSGKMKLTKKNKRRLRNGWKKCEHDGCHGVYNPKWKRSHNYPYCNLHYKSAKKIEESKLREKITKQGFGKFVYIFDLGFDCLYKIGRSTDWDRRLKALQGSNPRMTPIAVVGTWGECASVEKAMHTRFKEHRKQREIFEFDDEGLDVVVTALMEYGKVVYPR